MTDLDNALNQCPLIAILRGLEPEEATAVGGVLLEAGFRVIEVPLNSPQPLESIRRLADAFDDQAIIGAGTVLRASDVGAVAKAGGRLVVMPHADTSLVKKADHLGLFCVPGVATPTEAFAALEAGADALKLFPAEALPPNVVKAWRAVIPKTIKLFPVGGITPDTMAPFLEAGASGFGLGSALYKPGMSTSTVLDNARAFIDRFHQSKG